MGRRFTIAAGVAVAARPWRQARHRQLPPHHLPSPRPSTWAGLATRTRRRPTRPTRCARSSPGHAPSWPRRPSTLIDQWDHQLREYLNGGGSKLWALTLTAWRVKGSTPTSFSYSYYCGVDVNNASDYLCNFTNSDHSDSGVMNPGDVVWYSFGNAGTRRVFPMVKISALFSSGIRLETPFRGWDACAGSATTLCSTAKY